LQARAIAVAKSFEKEHILPLRRVDLRIPATILHLAFLGHLRGTSLIAGANFPMVMVHYPDGSQQFRDVLSLRGRLLRGLYRLS